MIIFSERQYFRQWWLMLLLVFLNGMVLFGFFWQVIGGQPLGNNPMSDTGYMFFLGFMALFTVFMLAIHLDTQIKEDGVYVRFFPFHIKWKRYAWEDMERCFVRTYRPVVEYGGWGLRGWGKNIAYNVSGDRGLQLKFKDGRSVLIGAYDSARMEEALQKLNKIKF